MTTDGRTAARVFAVALGLAAVAVTIWGFRITANVRRTAVETDRSLRSLAWAMLCYADLHGAFPPAEEPLVAFGPGGEEIAPEPAGDWPRLRTTAMAGVEPKPLAATLREIRVLWTASGAVAPYLVPDGLPSGVGTISEVNRWLDARGRAAAGPSGSATMPASRTDSENAQP